MRNFDLKRYTLRPKELLRASLICLMYFQGLDHCKTVYDQSLLYVGSLDRLDRDHQKKIKYRNNAKTGQTTCKGRKYNISAGQHQPSSGLLNETRIYMVSI